MALAISVGYRQPHHPWTKEKTVTDHANTPDRRSLFANRNIRLFLLFRIFFNARFYYPVFTILFLDFGLTLSQFAILNVVWAATIVLLEVPSGALADTVGRQKLLVFTGVLMVFEIGILCFAPRGNPDLLFALFLINRVISGTAEASASGADEAIAYDSLKADGMAHEWGRVLEIQIRCQSAAYIAAMLIGAAVYDPALMQTIGDYLGLGVVFTQDMTLRFPLYLTFVMALITLFIVLRIKDIRPADEKECLPLEECGPSIREAFRLTFNAGKWILGTPFVLVIIMSGLLFDGISRVVITLSSQYYRVIDLPEASFGLIGAGIATLGLFLPRIARRMADGNRPAANMAALAAAIALGLTGMSFFIPGGGLIPAALLFSAMYFTGFFTSYYINRETESHQRATVLSFKGLAFNLSYGLLGMFYSLLLAFYRQGASVRSADMDPTAIENFIFMDSFIWFPVSFAVLFTMLLLLSLRLLRRSKTSISCP